MAGRTLTPSEDEARVMSPEDGRLRNLFDELRLQSSLLLGAGVWEKELPLHRSGGECRLFLPWPGATVGEHLLTRRPAAFDEWLRMPNGLLDPTTALQQMCSEFKIRYSMEFRRQGPAPQPEVHLHAPLRGASG